MKLPVADHELTDAEIEERFGNVLREGIALFRSDPEYLIDMANVASAKRRQRRKAREARERQKVDT